MVTYSGDEYICFPGITQEINGVILVSLLELNGLIKIDVDTGIAQFLACFQHESAEFQLHTQMIAYQDKVVFVPWNAEHIAVYHMGTDRWKYVPAHNNRKPGRFISGRQNGKYLYLMLEDALQITKFDMDTEEIVGNYVLKSDSDFESLSYVRPIKTSQTIWKIAQKGNVSWKFDLQDNRYTTVKYLFGRPLKFVAGCSGKDYIWIIADDDTVYQLTTEGENIRQYNINVIMSSIYKDENREILESIFLNEMLIIVSYEKNCIIKVPVTDGILEVVRYQCFQFKNAFFSVEEDKLIITTDNELIIIEDTGEKRVIPRITGDFFARMMIKKRLVVKECNSCFLGDVGDYCAYIISEGNLLSNIDSPHTTIGEKIFDVVRRGDRKR